MNAPACRVHLTYPMIPGPQACTLSSAPFWENVPECDNQWSNYQKISKGAHTIVNANEAMLLITGGSRTSESGGQIFSEIFLRLFRGVSENLFAFFPKKCSSILPCSSRKRLGVDLCKILHETKILRGAKVNLRKPGRFSNIGGARARVTTKVYAYEHSFIHSFWTFL